MQSNLQLLQRDAIFGFITNLPKSNSPEAQNDLIPFPIQGFKKVDYLKMKAQIPPVDSPGE